MVLLTVHEKYHVIFKAVGFSSIVVSTYLYLTGHQFADMIPQNFLNYLVLLMIGIFCAFMEIKVPKHKTQKELIEGTSKETSGD